MWGTSSPDDKLVSDLAKATEAIKIAARRSDRLMAGKLSPLNFGLLQQNLPIADLSRCSKGLLYPISLSALIGTASFGESTIRGSRIVKVEPRPGSLATVMSPPII